MAHRNRDARAAADATAQNNLEAAQTAAIANRVNQTNPWGSTSWTNNNGVWNATQTLSPQQQAIFDLQQATQLGMLGGIGSALSQLDYGPIDTSGMAQYAVNPGQTAQDAIMSRLQPSLARQHDALRSELVNQGFNVSDAGYTQGMDESNRQATDAYQQAALAGISLAMQQRGQQFGEAYQQANRPAMLASMLAGTYQPVQAPSAYNASVPQQATMPGADYLGALGLANQERAAAAQNKAGLYSGIGSLAGAGAAAGIGALGMFS